MGPGLQKCFRGPIWLFSFLALTRKTWLSCQSVSSLLFRVCNCPVRWLVWVIMPSYPLLPLTWAVFFLFFAQCVFLMFSYNFLFLCSLFTVQLFNCSALAFGFGLALSLSLFLFSYGLVGFVHGCTEYNWESVWDGRECGRVWESERVRESERGRVCTLWQLPTTLLSPLPFAPDFTAIYYVTRSVDNKPASQMRSWLGVSSWPIRTTWPVLSVIFNCPSPAY